MHPWRKPLLPPGIPPAPQPPTIARRQQFFILKYYNCDRQSAKKNILSSLGSILCWQKGCLYVFSHTGKYPVTTSWSWVFWVQLCFRSMFPQQPVDIAFEVHAVKWYEWMMRGTRGQAASLHFSFSVNDQKNCIIPDLLSLRSIFIAGYSPCFGCLTRTLWNTREVKESLKGLHLVKLGLVYQYSLRDDIKNSLLRFLYFIAKVSEWFKFDLKT